MSIDISLDNLDALFPPHFSEEQLARGKTAFLQELSVRAHRFYGGKQMTIPKAGVFGFNWFNVWYTPGVSAVSTTIRDNNDASFDLISRGNMAAVVSDSTRVLGDGDVTPPGGLGVMEGKAFLMKYLGGVDCIPLCIDSRNEKGENDPDNIIRFVKMVQHSFGAINLEDISQPNCFKVLDVLREESNIPVWHDDAQGTGLVTLAGLINALKIVDKPIDKIKLVLYGAGASNTTIARLILQDGADPSRMYMFDTRGGLHKKRDDIKADTRFYRKWEICEQTNPECIDKVEDAMRGADAVIALSKPDPNTIKPEWIRSMAKKSIVFACANPVPEIYPYAAKEAGAMVVATGRGDFPNQVNNSLGFPAVLKGALLVRARKITDGMARAAAHSIAESAERNGIHPDYIMPTMSEPYVFPREATAVALKAIEEGVARIQLAAENIYDQVDKDIKESRALFHHLMNEGFIQKPPASMIEECLAIAIKKIEQVKR